MTAKLSYTSTYPAGEWLFSSNKNTYSVHSSKIPPNTSKYSSKINVLLVGNESFINSIHLFYLKFIHHLCVATFVFWEMLLMFLLVDLLEQFENNFPYFCKIN